MVLKKMRRLVLLHVLFIFVAVPTLILRNVG